MIFLYTGIRSYIGTSCDLLFCVGLSGSSSVQGEPYSPWPEEQQQQQGGTGGLPQVST